MQAQTVFFHVNTKTIFCLALVSTLTNLAFTQNLYTSVLDDIRNTLMTFASGANSPGTAAPPSNKFLEALYQIESAVYEAVTAGSRTHNTANRLADIKAIIKLATQKRNYVFARKSLGYGLYRAIQMDRNSGSKRRGTTSAVMTFMNSIKNELGDSAYDTLLGVNGEVTLMLALDNTGSMGGTIEAAKDIATSIINHPRKEKVDVILSPFNDPETGPVTYYSYREKNQFKNAIQAQRANGGGDCPELTFKGILDAMAESPQSGSPLYVFTDATAKDATDDNIREALEYAKMDGITINFFTTDLCGQSSYEPFEKLARETCGLMLKRSSSNELRNFAGPINAILKGSTCLARGSGSGSPNGRKRRSAVGSNTYNILVDDTTETIIITVSTERMGPNIDLRDPMGASVTSGKIPLSKGAIYEINDPTPGTWNLIVSGAGKHTYLVKGSSKANVDFGYFFVMPNAPTTGGRSRKPISISHPLLGERAVVILTVAGSNKINSRSLTLDLMSMDGRRLSTTTVTPQGSSGAHFSASFTPPSAPFKLKLRGTTKEGNSFERKSHNTVHPSHVLIRVVWASNDYTIPTTGISWKIVSFTVHNRGPGDVFDVQVKNLKFVSPHNFPKSIPVFQGSEYFFSVEFTPPSSSARGENEVMLLTLTGRTSGKTFRKFVRLMII